MISAPFVALGINSRALHQAGPRRQRKNSASLPKEKKRRMNNSDIIVGRNAVREALRAGRGLQKIYIQTTSHGGSLADIQTLAEKAHIPVELVPKEKMDRLAGGCVIKGWPRRGLPYRLPILIRCLAECRLPVRRRFSCFLMNCRIRRMWGLLSGRPIRQVLMVSCSRSGAAVLSTRSLPGYRQAPWNIFPLFLSAIWFRR